MSTLDHHDTISSVMANDLVTCDPTASLVEIAGKMRDHDIGDVLVVKDDDLVGIVTDRDIAVRGVASGAIGTLTASDVMTSDLATVESVCTRTTAAELMARKAIRRLPVVDAGKLVGIVSLGDLAEDHAPHTVLGEISDAPPNN